MNFLYNDNIGKLIIRLTVGILLLLHGINKLMNLDGSMGWIGEQLLAVGLPSFMAYGAIIGEVIAPLMIIFGIYTRVGGMLVVGQMLFAIGLAHMGDLASLTDQGGWAIELQAFFLFTGLALIFLGSGKYALKAD